MIIEAKLPKDRTQEGQIYVDGSLMGRCRGKADNQAAMDHGNSKRDPRRPFGDHPAGRYVVSAVVDVTSGSVHSYGPYKIVIQPFDLTSDDECTARENAEPGDDGILIHGGDPQADGVSLRATYGCLRVANTVIRSIANLVKEALARGEAVEYICTNV